MEELWKQIAAFLIQGGGGFGVAALVEGLVILRLFNLLLEGHKREVDQALATAAREKEHAKELHGALTERSEELERFTNFLQKGRR